MFIYDIEHIELNTAKIILFMINGKVVGSYLVKDFPLFI